MYAPSCHLVVNEYIATYCYMTNAVSYSMIVGNECNHHTHVMKSAQQLCIFYCVACIYHQYITDQRPSHWHVMILLVSVLVLR